MSDFIYGEYFGIYSIMSMYYLTPIGDPEIQYYGYPSVWSGTDYWTYVYYYDYSYSYHYTSTQEYDFGTLTYYYSINTWNNSFGDYQNYQTWYYISQSFDLYYYG